MERSELRAADADRRRVADELQRHYVDGRLSSDELSERVSRALAARTYGELEALLRDLPPSLAPAAAEPAGVDAAPGDADGRQAGPWDRRDFRAHATAYVLVMVLLVAIWLLTTPGGYFWPVWPMLGWGIGLAVHALARRDRRSGTHVGRRR